MPRTVGRYQLVRALARGGMAEVFLARRRAGGLEKLLVVKRIRPERANDTRFLELFLREARLSMGLTHQNIVPVFDFGKSGDQVFLAMERVEGRDLGATLAQADGPPAALIAAFIAAECCQALTYAHDRRDTRGQPLGIVHRDVTPRNILVSWSGEVKLTDFGIAALGDDDHHRVVGTPSYLAPEQARGEPVDNRADVYALGMILRELVTGTRARAGDDREQLLAAARAGALEAWPAGIDPTLQAIATRATAPDREARYASARSMLADLDRYIVARRAAVADEAPSSQLAAWMRSVWGETQDEPVDASQGLEDGGLESFLDDGDNGSRTERSLAVTAAEDAASQVAPVLAPTPTSVPDRTPPVPRRRAVVPARLAVLIAVVIVASGTIWATQRREARAPAAAAPADAAVRGDATVAAPSVDAASAADAAPAVDAALPVDATADAVAVDSAPVTDAPRGGASRPVRVDASAAPVDAGESVLRRTLRVNARPWAMVYLDGSSTGVETIATFQVSPGRHQLRFVNPQLQVERVVTLDVPADRDLDHVEDLRP